MTVLFRTLLVTLAPLLIGVASAESTSAKGWHIGQQAPAPPEPEAAAPVKTAAPPAQQHRDLQELTRRLGDKRPDDQLTVEFLDRPLIIGGEYGFEPEYEKDFALDRAVEDDRLTLEQEVQLELAYKWSDDLTAFVETKLLRDDDLYAEDDDRDSSTELQRGESWIFLAPQSLAPVAFQIGRQNFREKREWWWDEDLDAARIHYRRNQFSFELAVAEELGRVSTRDDIDPEADDVTRLLAHATWEWARKQRLEFFILHQNDHSDTPAEGLIVDQGDEDESDADLTWLGLRAAGRWKIKPWGRLYYWFDYAAVRGDEDLIDYDDIDRKSSVVDDVDRFDIRGWAVDLGATWVPPDFPARITLGYAHGSGDGDLDDDTDRSFRQTGLQDNNSKFRGVNRFRYYGELLRPELSNLRVLTLAAGWSFWRESSVEVLYHRYRQVDKTNFLRDSDLRARPTGSSRSIGDELDIVIGIEEWVHWELELVAALFRSGAAFGPLDDETAFALFMKVNYNF